MRTLEQSKKTMKNSVKTHGKPMDTMEQSTKTMEKW